MRVSPPSAAQPREPNAPASDEPPIEDVIVTGTRFGKTAGSAHVINQRQLERFERDDVHSVLRQAPGVYIREEDGMGLRPNIGIRGGNPDRSKKVTMMEDGVLLGPAPYSAPAAYFMPLVTRMTRVRVLKGPSAIAFGPQTVGGAIDFTTRAIPSQTSGGLDLALGEFRYNKAHAYFGSSDEQVGFLVEGLRLNTTGFAELPTGADTGSTRSEWMSKASYIIDPRAEVLNEIGVKFTHSDEVSNETYLGLPDDVLRATPYRRLPASALDQMKLQRNSIVLTHKLSSADSPLRLTTNIYSQHVTRVWNKLNRLGGASVSDVLRNPDEPLNEAFYGVLSGQYDSSSPAETLYIGPNDRELVSRGLQSVLELGGQTGPISHRLEVGTRLHQDQVRRLHTESGFLMSGGTLVPDGQATLTTARNQASSLALAAHVMDVMAYRRLSLTPGVRVELIGSSTSDHLTGETRDAWVHAVMPGIGAFYEITDTFGVLTGVYRGFSPPAPASGEHVEPEYSVNYEAGVRFNDGPRRAEVIGFYNDYTNMSDVCTQSSGCLTENLDRQFDAGEARIFGFEAFVGDELPIGSLTLPLSVAYTFTRGEFLSSFQSQDPIYGNVTSGDQIPYLPGHQVNATVGLENQHGGGIMSVNYVSPMREEASGGPLESAWATDEQLWLDASVYARLLEPLTLYANLRNVLHDASIVARRPYGARVNPPRWFQVGAKLDF